MLARTKKNRLIILFLSFILVFSFFVRYKKIKGSLPYIGHPDEPEMTRYAVGIIKTGDFNPHNFAWPSLPYYLTAASLSLGYISSVSKQEIRLTDDIGRVTYPYYSEKRLVYPAKLLLAILSIMGMLLSGLIAYNVFRNKHVIYLTPLLLTLSRLYLYHSAQYLNPDIIGTFFALLTIWYVTKNPKTDSYLNKAVIPGILCGLSIASKYNFYLLLVPSAFSIIFFSKKQKLEKIFLLLFVSILAFIICVPYSILDFDRFLDGIAFNIIHYKSVHAGFSSTPGLSQFIYYCRALIDEFGIGFIGFTLLGIFYSMYLNPKKGLVLLSYPLISLISLSSLPVHFLRNILATYVFVCIYCSFGTLFAFKYLRSRLKELPIFNKNKIYQKGVAVFLCTAFIFPFLPLNKIFNDYDLKPDSRNLSIRWIKEKIPSHSRLFIPQELDLDIRELGDKYKISFFNGLKLKGDFSVYLTRTYVLVPHYGYDSRDIGGKDISSRLNASFKNVTKIAEFGKNPVLVNYFKAVPTGNPKFYIGKIK